MLKRLCPPVTWLAGLLLVSLWLVACGSMAGIVSEEPTTSAQAEGADASCASTTSSAACAETQSAQTEVAAAAPADETETSQAATSSEEAVITETAATEEAVASSAENLTAASPGATCQAIDVPGNQLIVPISADDWSKGPANAPVTLIEYGDFQ
jgi:hypothetical protein